MIIELGTQVNCSELVIRLADDYTPDEVRNKLKEHGIIEVVVKDFYGRGEQDWDDQYEVPIPTDNISPEVLKLMYKARTTCTDSEYAGLRKELLKHGFDDYNFTKMLIKKGGSPDYENGSHFWIDEFVGDGQLGIMYAQHCQEQGFPLLREISEIFDIDIEASDGGNVSYYEDWLDEQNA